MNNVLGYKLGSTHMLHTFFYVYQMLHERKKIIPTWVISKECILFPWIGCHYSKNKIQKHYSGFLANIQQDIYFLSFPGVRVTY